MANLGIKVADVISKFYEVREDDEVRGLYEVRKKDKPDSELLWYFFSSNNSTYHSSGNDCVIRDINQSNSGYIERLKAGFEKAKSKYKKFFWLVLVFGDGIGLAPADYEWIASVELLVGLDDITASLSMRTYPIGKGRPGEWKPGCIRVDQDKYFNTTFISCKDENGEFTSQYMDPYFSIFDSRPHHDIVVVEVTEDEIAANDAETDIGEYLTPEWFNEKGKAFLYLDDEVKEERDRFLSMYSPEVLGGIEGIGLLRKIFLNDENKDNLCYDLEFNPKLKELFGSIKGGAAYKYGLFFNQKTHQWTTGSGQKPQPLSVDEAVELGTQIRDYLLVGADILKKYSESPEDVDYEKLYAELNEATDGNVGKVWFLKYYQMLAPELFPPIYSQPAQTTVLNAIGIAPGDNPVVRLGQLQSFVNRCEVSSVVLSRTFWTNYEGSQQDDEELPEKEAKVSFCTGYQSDYSRNRIFFGAPGTGKSFSLEEDRKKLMGEDNETDYERVTFHPDYSYANFVGTYKPVPCTDSDGKDTITYEYVPGPFMRVYVEALKNSREKRLKAYLLLIEEINRANVAAVFGDIFQLLDRGDDEVSEYPIQASEDIKKYLHEQLKGDIEDYSKIRIPDNMFIWATMNSADQGVFPMDTAFKRRWDFTYLGIDDKDTDIRGNTVELGFANRQRVEWNKLRKAINHFLARQKINEDKQLGPYFISRKIVVPESGNEIDREKFIETFKNKVIMYLFEDAGRQKRASLFEGCFDNSTRYSEICREFDEKGIGIFNREIQIEAEPEDLTIKWGEVSKQEV